MIRRFVLLILLAIPASALPPPGEPLIRLGVDGDVQWREDGRVGEIRGLALPGWTGEPGLAALAVVEQLGEDVAPRPIRESLEPVQVRESLTGRHVRLQQFFEGEAVRGGEVVVRFDGQGALRSLSNRTALPVLESVVRRQTTNSVPPVLRGHAILGSERVPVARDGRIVFVRSWIADDPPFGHLTWEFDEDSGDLLGITPSYATATALARIFLSNPVSRLNRPDLRDHDDDPAAVPFAAYSDVEITLSDGPGLRSARVEIVDLEAPKTVPADAAGTLIFDRGDDRFEDVMAFFHIDESLRHIESLGYTGARAIGTRPLQADAHASNGADQSFYRFAADGEGSLFFGDGGVDDAEDPDIILHELGHAIQDRIAPFVFAGSYASEARAAGEGFGDYWAFVSSYEENLRSGRDPYCIGDWDARCGGSPSTGCGYPENADCLRRVDGAKTMDDFIPREQAGTEHQNGEIWSSALREIFVDAVSRMGVSTARRMIDTIVIESHFGVPPRPTFRSLGLHMLEADALLFESQNRAVICAALSSRGIFNGSDCGAPPRGEFKRLDSLDGGVPIPDNDGAGIRSTRYVADPRRIEGLRVGVRISHPFRGDLRIELIAPDGRTAVLQLPNQESVADIEVIYGLDIEPRESFSIFTGMSAQGEWTLRVTDTRFADAGTLMGWFLSIAFEGETPIAARSEVAGGVIHVPVIGRAPGAHGTMFVSDVTILNRGDSEVTVAAFFTPSGSDGTTAFSAVRLAIAPGQQILLADLVASEFRTTGAGSLEIRGETELLVVSSRTYNDDSAGTFGQRIPAVEETTAAGEDALHVIALRNDSSFRSNIGFSESAGRSGRVSWQVFDRAGRVVEEGSVEIAPYSHAQVASLLGTSVQAGRAVIRVVSGEARIAAYGSIIDNQTGDAIFIPATRPRRDGTAHLAAVVRGEGAQESFWRSDLWITNLSSAPAHFDLTWIETGREPESRRLSLAAGESVLSADVLSALFGAERGTGRLAINTAASVWLGVSRAWTPGSYGQAIPISDTGEGISGGEPRKVIPQLHSSDRFRTNVGLAEISGAEALVRLRVVDGGGREQWGTLISLLPGQQHQISLALAGAPPFVNGYAWVDVVGGSGRVLAYGSVIDNRSGDPIYIPAH